MPDFLPDGFGKRSGGGIHLRGGIGGSFGAPPAFMLKPDMVGSDTVTHPYTENPWVRAGIKAISTGFASLPFELWRGEPDEEGSKLFDERHPVVKLLKRPNALQTAKEFWKAHSVNTKLDGESVWFLANAKAEPVMAVGDVIKEMPEQIIMARGSQVEHLTNKNGVITHWRFSLGGGKWSQKWDAGAVIHFNDYDPYNPIRGMGDAQALLSSIDTYFQMERYVTTVLRNGGDPGAWIVYDEMISVDEIDRRQAEADDEYGIENRGRVKVLGKGAKVTPNRMTPRDMEYLSGLEFQRDVILAVLGVQPPVVGIQDTSTYNNIETATREMWTGPNGILPAIAEPTNDGIENKLLWRLRELLPQDQYEARARFNIDAVTVLQEAQDDKIKLAAETAGQGLGISFNEALATVGAKVEYPDGGNEPLLANTFREPVAATQTERSAHPADNRPGLDGEHPNRVQSAGPAGQGSSPVGSLRAAARKPRVNSKLAKGVLDWLREYEAAQIKHIEDFAETGKAPASKPQKRSSHTLSKADLDQLLLNEEQWSAALEIDAEPGVLSATRNALSAVRGDMPNGPFLSVTDPEIVDQMLSQRALLAQSVGATTRERVRNAIVRSMSGSDPSLSLQAAVKEQLPKLTKDLKKVFGTKDQRASAIAQTETGKANNNTFFAQFIASGVSHVQWLTANDDLVRETHAANAAQGEIPIGDSFSNGMRHPHDPSAHVSEVVNCRCEIVATKFKEEEDTDG